MVLIVLQEQKFKHAPCIDKIANKFFEKVPNLIVNENFLLIRKLMKKCSDCILFLSETNK